MDVRHAEQVVSSLLEKNLVDRHIKPMFLENNWNTYKHLFASDFSQDDFEAFNRFFLACAEVSEARRVMNEIFYAGLQEKAACVQQMLLGIDSLNPEDFDDKRKSIISRVNSETFVFDPDEPKERVLRNLSFLGRISTTVAFHKLKKIAERKRLFIF